MSYSWVLFDIDGTLFDYDTAETAALAATFTRFHLDLQPNHAQAYSRINGRMWMEFEQGTTTQERLRVERFRDLFEAIEIDADPTPFSDEYLKQLARRTDLIDGAESTAAALASRVSLMVITNGLADVQRPRFAASSIRHHFQGIVISEEVGAAKPDPRIFDEAFARMDHPPKQEVLIVGDSLSSDIAGGRNYGIDTCWFNPDRHVNEGDVAPTHEIRNLAALTSLVPSR